MQRLMQGYQQFRDVSFPNKRELFEKVAGGQSPHSLIISCADSRVIPEIFTSSDPGEVFVCRNVGAIVPPYSPFTGGVSAAIEYAVAVLGVANVVVCGHSDCGAMKATLNPEGLSGLPAVSDWLRHAHVAKHVIDANYNGCSKEESLAALTEENVVAQLDHLMTHPSVAARVSAGSLRLHGWVYDLKTGGIKAYSTVHRQFVPLDASSSKSGDWPCATPPARTNATGGRS